jgi:hypothetical protein
MRQYNPQSAKFVNCDATEAVVVASRKALCINLFISLWMLTGEAQLHIPGLNVTSLAALICLHMHTEEPRRIWRPHPEINGWLSHAIVGINLKVGHVYVE